MEQENSPFVRPLPVEENFPSIPKIALIFVAVIILGVVSGFIFSTTKKFFTSRSSTTSSPTAADVKANIGIKDKKTFKDSAEGMLREGGIDGEGQFHLERQGGESQNVYLTSTTVDLSKYVGRKVRVWGETFKAEKAGWLMDVGLVELL